MVAVKMFWDMWKNLTSATTNWSFTGGNTGGGNGGGGGGQHGSNKSKGSSSKPTRYNRLQSSYGPSKSQSHPANLMSFASNLESSSSSSSSSLESLATATSSVVPTLRSIEPTTSATTAEAFDSKSRWKGDYSSSSPSIRQSFSSTFPLTSATPTSTELPAPTPPAKTSMTEIIAKLQPPPALPSTEAEQILNQTGTNETPGRSLDSGQGSCWKTAKEGKLAPGPSDNFFNLEKVADDGDGEGDHEGGNHTCEVCNRAFPTFKKIADHQRKKRHYGCIQCDSIFPSREVLECHQEQMCHYECGDAHNGYDYDEDEDEDDSSFQTEDDENGLGDCSEDCDDEERERLL